MPVGKVNFEISINSELPLNSISVSHYKNAELQVSDTLLYTTEKRFEFSYEKDFLNLVVPGDEVIIKIVATNEGGMSSTLLKKIIFKSIPNPMLEGQFFYSHDNTIYNAYSMSNFEVITRDSSNTGQIDVQDFVEIGDTSFTPNLVSNQWVSPNGGLFAPIQSSFYETSMSDLPVIFENSGFGNTTGTLHIGDVLIFKNHMGQYYLILLKDIYEGPLGGRYTFDVRY
jgi:hypothetical protein